MRSRCCLCVCLCIPLIVARQRLGRNVTAVTRNNRRTVGHVVFSVARVVSRKVGNSSSQNFLLFFVVVT
jgi:hypothetical protein